MYSLYSRAKNWWIYTSFNTQHVKNEKIYAIIMLTSICNKWSMEKRLLGWKIHTICYYFSSFKTWMANDWIWKHARIFEILKIDKTLYKQWSDYYEWEMANCMHNVVLATTWHVIQASHLIHWIAMR